MRRRQFKDESSHTYWQSVTDALSGLILLLLLILMMFMVRILYFSSDATAIYEHEGEGDNNYKDGYDYDSKDFPYDFNFPTYVGNNASADGADGEEKSEENNDKNGKINEKGYAAVMVRLNDVDTGKAIEEAAVRFEIYNAANVPMQLTVHYPEETTYRYFETRDDGTFYVPEKLPIGTYTLRNLSSASGYTLGENISFTVDKDYDWNNPLIVSAPLGPERNIIYFRLVDFNGNSVNLPGKFDIYANADIITEDGTRRYVKNELVDTVVCDNRGRGESNELYLGEYRIETSFEEDFYAGDSNNVVVLSSRDSENGDIINDIVCEKTTIAVKLHDELYEQFTIGSAEFVLRDTLRGTSQNGVTDSLGHLEFTDLYKDTTYQLQQLSTSKRYYSSDDTYEFYVDHFGLIENSPVADVNLTNWMIRIALSLTDTHLNQPVADLSVSLYDSSGELVASFISGKETKEIEGLSYGTYRVEVADRGISETIEVKNLAEVQSFTVNVETKRHVYLLAGVALTAGLLAGALLLVIKKRKGNR